MFDNKKILVFGMARSGYAVSKFLSNHTNSILVVDEKEQDYEKVKELNELGVEVAITKNPEELLDKTYDVIVKNPGIPREHALLKKAKRYQIPVLNEMEIAYAYLPKGVKIIGVTGSNGKTTTVTIIYEFLKEQGLPVHLAGNIGIPLTEIMDSIQAGDLLVLEISDHQLYDLYQLKTDVSVVTNLSEVHLDFHGSFEKYLKAKQRIFQNHTEKEIAVLNLDNEYVLKISKKIPSQKLYFSDDSEKADAYIKNGYLYYHHEPMIELSDIRVHGIHNYENIMCAMLVGNLYGVTKETMKKVLNDFGGVEHRLEFVDRIEEKEFYNDSKSTNNESTIIALQSFVQPVVLILGGLDRGQSFEELKGSLEHVSQVIALGETKEKIKTFCDEMNLDCVLVDTIEDAVRAGFDLANPNDVILLSPACASWDMYPSFEARGEEFKTCVENLKKERE
ncbi:MAG: UDP-N-acetylmuramoyl-L-alanine--D-glutamate ligase [Firmicutes bacterium]|nr:UDP-N-acetylmuramoyl-L-alanine--D-glutamate ligase [Bacillota bacterium]